jgi:hypothetical protein
MLLQATVALPFVIAGLDPAIQGPLAQISFLLDARVKSGHDEEGKKGA